MANIEKRHSIDENNLCGISYFTSLLQEAYTCGLLSDSAMENIQLQCIHFLAYKSERYNSGVSSSIRVETAEGIMKSNLYTIGLYLKSLPDADCAVNELKRAKIRDMYQQGRALINSKLQAAKHIYRLVQKNRVSTVNYTYNATISDQGIGSFFTAYNPDYEAHESPAFIDYQLCHPVANLAGVEFIQKYLENLYLENAFCGNFAAEDIHHLLCGYDEGYKDLLINVFEQVLTAALGCLLANRSVRKLDISEHEMQWLHRHLAKDGGHSLPLTIHKAAGRLLEEMHVTNPSLRSYIEKSLPGIITNIAHGVDTNTLGKVFVSPVNPDLNPQIRFFSGIKMDDEDYRKLIDELLVCRYASDKFALIKEKVKSFGDFEDVLFDAELSEEEITSAFDILGDVEIAALMRRHPFRSKIEAVDLSEPEQALRRCLKSYMDQLPIDRQGKILEIGNSLIDEW